MLENLHCLRRPLRPLPPIPPRNPPRPHLQIIIADDSSQTQTPRFKPLLPRRFRLDDLLHKDLPLLLETHDNGLSFPNGDKGSIDALKVAALAAANTAHASYNACPSNMAVVDRSGRVFAGSYMESMAYNSSLGPVQAAIVAYIVGGRERYEGIVAVVLVEKYAAVIRSEETARLLLRTISPECEFRVFHCVEMKKSGGC